MSLGRILAITSNFPRWPGDSTTPFVLHLAQDLCDLGWEVDVLAPHAPGAALSEEFGRVHVRRFRYLLPESAQTVCYQGGALINLRQRKSNWLKLPALVGAELAATAWALRSGRYNLLHSHWALPQGFVGSLAGRLFDIPHVLTAHGSDVLALNGPLLSHFKRYALEHATAVTVNSSVSERAVVAVAPRQKAVHRISIGTTHGPLAAGPTPDDIRHQYRRGEGPLLVFVGRLIREKGVDDVIHAVRQVSQNLPGTVAMILGEGQERAEFEALARDTDVADRVQFLGWVAPDAVPNYLAAADVFVGPSKRSVDGGVEAQGLTFAEAMFAGTPVIATRSGGIVDIVRDEDTGLLVDEGQPQQIAAAIRRLHGDRSLSERLAANGKTFSSAHLTREVSAAKFSSLFSRLVQTPGSSVAP